MANWGIADVERAIKEAIEIARAWTVRNAEVPAQKKKGFWVFLELDATRDGIRQSIVMLKKI
ncbi:MAG TPA: hypothetical protein VMM54_01785 [Nitrospirota bacterium]|nr:hypothetical protein [Nitrospirota bacterium]